MPSKVHLKTLFVLIISSLLAFAVHADDLNEISQNIKPSAELIAKGKTIFMGNCMSCHGAEGKGDGPAAAAFNPKPRNFTGEPYKQGGSPSAVFYTVTHGMGSMPAFTSLPVADRLAVVHYTLSLSPKIDADTPETLAKIGLGPDGKPLAGFKGESTVELPVEFIIARMAEDGKVDSLDYKKLLQDQEASKVASTPQAPSAPVKADLEKGKVLFQSCKACHGGQGEGDFVAKAPQLAGQDLDYLLTQLHNFQSGARGSHPEDVNGMRMRPMARILQTEEDLVSVAHYIKTLTPKNPVNTLGAGSSAKGQAAYATCAACHGADAKGVAAMKAPSLKYLQDWYMTSQIQSFKKGYRGTDSRDTGGSQMRGMAMSIPDDQTVLDLVAYIQSIQNK